MLNANRRVTRKIRVFCLKKTFRFLQTRLYESALQCDEAFFALKAQKEKKNHRYSDIQLVQTVVSVVGVGINLPL